MGVVSSVSQFDHSLLPSDSPPTLQRRLCLTVSPFVPVKNIQHLYGHGGFLHLTLGTVSLGRLHGGGQCLDGVTLQTFLAFRLHFITIRILTL